MHMSILLKNASLIRATLAQMDNTAFSFFSLRTWLVIASMISMH